MAKLRKKIVIIRYCFECPNIRPDQFTWPNYCSKEERELTKETIPKWCPLEDAK
jgi:hypothetical protein